jgi:hypothetical protein
MRSRKAKLRRVNGEKGRSRVLQTRTANYSAKNADSGSTSEGVRNSELFGQKGPLSWSGDLRMLPAGKTTDRRDVVRQSEAR